VEVLGWGFVCYWYVVGEILDDGRETWISGVLMLLFWCWSTPSRVLGDGGWRDNEMGDKGMDNGQLANNELTATQ